MTVIRVSPPYRAWVSVKIYSHLFQALSQSRWTQNMVEYEMAWRNISQPFLWISQPPCLLAHNLFLLWHSLLFTNWEPVISQIYHLVVKASWFHFICFIRINFRTGLPDQNELTDHCFTNQARKKNANLIKPGRLIILTHDFLLQSNL